MNWLSRLQARVTRSREKGGLLGLPFAPGTPGQTAWEEKSDEEQLTEAEVALLKVQLEVASLDEVRGHDGQPGPEASTLGHVEAL